MVLVHLFYALVLSSIHLLADRFCVFCSDYKAPIISFGAGVSITYLFLDLLPSFMWETFRTSNTLLFFFLGGFLLTHLFEKHIYKAHTKYVRKSLTSEHETIFFIYYFLIGFVLIEFVMNGSANAILFIIPLGFHSFTSAISLHTSHTRTESRTVLFLLASAPFVGAVVSTFVDVIIYLKLAAVGLVLGSMTYIIIRDSIPVGKQGEPAFFSLGVIVYGLILFFLQNFI